MWVYPETSADVPEGIVCVETAEAALNALARGEKVLFEPKTLPRAVPASFSTDFWSVGTFPYQSGTMGQWIDADHPLFARFPTQAHTDWQWWPMASGWTLPLPMGIKGIVTTLDSFATLRNMAQLFECRVGAGRLMCSTMNLPSLNQYPEARALRAAILSYMASSAFEPDHSMTPDALREITGEQPR